MTDSAVFHETNDDSFRDSSGPITSFPGAGAGAVDSVFGRTGAVTAATSDYDANQVDFTPGGTISATNVQAAIEEVASEASAPVSSVFTRTGAVVAVAGDYTAAEVTNVPAGGIAAVTVQAALNELDTEKLASGASAGGVLDGTFPNPGLAAGVAGAGLAESSDVLSVNVDGTTIEITADALNVKSGVFDAAGAAAAAQAASQPLDGDLTAIAGLDSSTSGAIASDGSGWIKKTYSQFKTALSLVKGDVGLGNVDNTADSAKNVATAAALTTARNIDGQAFDGTGNITVIAPGTHAATGKTTPVDADELALVDSAASNVLKKLTWANLKATIKAYTDTLYPSGSGTSTGTNTGDQTVPSFATPAIVLGSAAAAGAASTVIRSDGTIAAFDTTVPSTQAFGDAAAVGTAAFAARRDHKHAMPALVPLGGSVVGAYYTTPLAGVANWQTAAGVLGSMYCVPIWLEAGTLDRIAQQHTSAATAGETMRLGIYNDTGRGAPGSLLLDAGTIDLSTTTGIKAITISQLLTRGLYWLASVRQGGSALAVMLKATFQNPGHVIVPQRGPGGTNLFDAAGAFLQTGVTSGLPDPFVGTTMVASGADVFPAFVRYS